MKPTPLPSYGLYFIHMSHVYEGFQSVLLRQSLDSGGGDRH